MKNLRLAIRSLLHFRLYTVINILGLALALACVIVIFRYVHGETTVNHFHEKADRIHLARNHTNRDLQVSDVTNRTRSKSNQDDFLKDPAIERVSLFYNLSDADIVLEEEKYTANTLIVDSNFLQILDFPLLSGKAWPLAPNEVLISESFSRKLFGSENPIGKNLRHSIGNDVTIIGIVDDRDHQNGLPFDLLLSSDLVRRETDENGITRVYISAPSSYLLLLHPGQDYRAMNRRYDLSLQPPTDEYLIYYQLHPLKEWYWGDFGDFLRHGNRRTTIILSIVGFLILLIGVVNFINIYTAVVLRRGREFGMKKVFGAHGMQIFIQLWLENVLLIGLALVIALALIELCNPLIKNILGFNQLPFVSFDFGLELGLLVCIPVVTTLVPFLRYNYSAPITSLRSIGHTGGRSATRKVFLGFQYGITLVMIIVSLFFLKQLRSMLSADPGFRTEDIIQATFQKRNTGPVSQETIQEMNDLQDEIRQKIDASPLFENWTFGTNPVSRGTKDKISIGEKSLEITRLSSNEKWMRLFEIPIVDGRMWDGELDHFEDDKFILSESAVRELGITDIRQTTITCETVLWVSVTRGPDGEGAIMQNGFIYTVVGVIPDIHTKHLGAENYPMVFLYGGESSYDPLLAAIAPGKRQEAIEFLRQLHDETVGGEFTYSFIEDDVKALYAEDRKVATIYSIFTVIAILISVLGLFSMSLFDVQQRYKEIAIRKVNGATTSVIIGLLLKKYIVLLGISFVIAVPVAWYAIQRYLEGFAYKTAVSWWIFAAALLITAGISLLTLIHQTRRAAAANPADVIRNE